MVTFSGIQNTVMSGLQGTFLKMMQSFGYKVSENDQGRPVLRVSEGCDVTLRRYNTTEGPVTEPQPAQRVDEFLTAHWKNEPDGGTTRLFNDVNGYFDHQKVNLKIDELLRYHARASKDDVLALVRAHKQDWSLMQEWAKALPLKAQQYEKSMNENRTQFQRNIRNNWIGWIGASLVVGGTIVGGIKAVELDWLSIANAIGVAALALPLAGFFLFKVGRFNAFREDQAKLQKQYEGFDQAHGLIRGNFWGYVKDYLASDRPVLDENGGLSGLSLRDYITLNMKQDGKWGEIFKCRMDAYVADGKSIQDEHGMLTSEFLAYIKETLDGWLGSQIQDGILPGASLGKYDLWKEGYGFRTAIELSLLEADAAAKSEKSSRDIKKA